MYIAPNIFWYSKDFTDIYHLHQLWLEYILLLVYKIITLTNRFKFWIYFESQTLSYILIFVGILWNSHFHILVTGKTQSHTSPWKPVEDMRKHVGAEIILDCINYISASHNFSAIAYHYLCEPIDYF